MVQRNIRRFYLHRLLSGAQKFGCAFDVCAFHATWHELDVAPAETDAARWKRKCSTYSSKCLWECVIILMCVCSCSFSYNIIVRRPMLRKSIILELRSCTGINCSSWRWNLWKIIIRYGLFFGYVLTVGAPINFWRKRFLLYGILLIWIWILYSILYNYSCMLTQLLTS